MHILRQRASTSTRTHWHQAHTVSEPTEWDATRLYSALDLSTTFMQTTDKHSFSLTCMNWQVTNMKCQQSKRHWLKISLCATINRYNLLITKHCDCTIRPGTIRACSAVLFLLLLFWHAPLGVDDSQPCQLFRSGERFLYFRSCWILGLHPRSTRASWWSPPVLQGAAVKISYLEWFKLLENWPEFGWSWSWSLVQP